MNGIFLWGTGYKEMAEATDLQDTARLPSPWPEDLAELAPWQDICLLSEGAGSCCRISGKKTAAPALFVTGACSSAMTLAWHFSALGLLPEWGSVISIRQWQGVGQLGRTWESPPGNLYVTVRLPNGVGTGPPAASLVAGYWIAGALRELGVPATLKWPNDIIVGEKKAGGILTQARSGVVLAGIGLNLVSAPPVESLRTARAIRATSLAETGCAFTPLGLWRRLLDRGPHYVGEALGLSPAGFRERFRALLAFAGRTVLVDDHSGTPYSGIVSGLSSDGELEVLVGSQLKTIRSGSIYPLDGS